MSIPENYLPIMPYLQIINAKAFIIFMQKVFNATIQLEIYDEQNLVKHVELKINKAVIMLGEATDKYPKKPAGMFIYVDDVNEIYSKALAEKSTSLMVPQTVDYGFTAGFEDSFGNSWWIVEEN